MSDPKTDEERLAELLLQWEEILEQGRDVSADELCRESPELIEELSRRIAALKAVDWVNRNGDTDNGDDGPIDPIKPPDEPVAGRYRLDRFIAEGGFGQVWQGFDLELERTVAVKMPKASRLASVDKFVAEARRVAQLKHPGIVPVFDVVRDGGNCLIVSEFVEGGSLADRIGKLEARDAIRLIGQIADTLHYAHQQGFIHRDIKPSNILIDHHGRALLADFGISTSSSEADDSSSLGTLAYMSPEQSEDNTIDHRTDIFSLGVVLVELLTGKRPFDAENPARLREEVLTAEPTLDALPSGMDSICRKCLARHIEDRYPDAEALAVDLNAWNTHRPSNALWSVVPAILLLAVAGYVISDNFTGDETTGGQSVSGQPAEQLQITSAPLSETTTGPMPKAAEAVHRQAGELFNAGNIVEALPLLDRAIQLDPTNPEIFKNRGLGHLNLGNFDLAVTDLETALKLDADNPSEYRKLLSQTYAAKAVKYAETQAWQQATTAMSRAIEYVPTADYFHRRASMYFNDKQYEPAIADWTEAIRLKPSVATYYENRSYALKATGRDEDAARDIEKAGELGVRASD